MSVRGFLTWYILAVALIGATGASVVQGLKWQRAERLLAASPAPVTVPATPHENVVATTVQPDIVPDSVPALRPQPTQRQHAVSQAVTRNARHVSKRPVIAKAEHPVTRRPEALAELHRDYPRGPYAAPWQGYVPYPTSPPPPYPPYAYRAYGPYVPAYTGYGWPRPPYYSEF